MRYLFPSLQLLRLISSRQLLHCASHWQGLLGAPCSSAQGMAITCTKQSGQSQGACTQGTAGGGRRLRRTGRQ